jgi:hypothetical protein
MSVNMFNVDMCRPPHTSSSPAPVLHPPKKGRRKQKKSNQTGALASVEERFKKLEDELRQVRLQLTRQERRIAELESKMACLEIGRRAANVISKRPLLPPTRTEPVRSDGPWLGKRRLPLLSRVVVPGQVTPTRRARPKPHSPLNRGEGDGQGGRDVGASAFGRTEWKPILCFWQAKDR